MEFWWIDHVGQILGWVIGGLTLGGRLVDLGHECLGDVGRANAWIDADCTWRTANQTPSVR